VQEKRVNTVPMHHSRLAATNWSFIADVVLDPVAGCNLTRTSSSARVTGKIAQCPGVRCTSDPLHSPETHFKRRSKDPV